MVAAIGDGDAFAKGRDFAAWLGLVPKQISIGDRTILGKISKRGNHYLRVLFVQAAWVMLIKPKSWEYHGLKRPGSRQIAAVLMHRSERGEAAERSTAPGYCYTGYTCSITRIIASFSSRKSRSSYLYKL
jgi:Transposase IS116/IS110/IS902 family